MAGQNYLSPLEFLVTIKRLPNTEFFTQSIQIPGINTTPVETENPFNRLMWTPEKVQYAPLDLSFMIDEDMSNYREIHDWIVGTASPQNPLQYRKLKESREGLTSDISVLIETNKKNANVLITYKDCFPIGLTPLQLDTRTHDVVYPQASATFVYNWFTIEKVDRSTPAAPSLP